MYKRQTTHTAQDAQEIIDYALDQVSLARSHLGSQEIALESRLQLETESTFQLSRSQDRIQDERFIQNLARHTSKTLKQQHHISYKTDALRHFGTQFLKILEGL